MWPSQPQFQSLLSQGISLLLRNNGDWRPPFRKCFNPFLVRASVYWVQLASDAEVSAGTDKFQSLLSQGISLLVVQFPD